MIDPQNLEAEIEARDLRPGWLKVQNVALPFGRHIVPQLLFMGDAAWRPTMLAVAMVFGEHGRFEHAGLFFDIIWNRPVTAFVFRERHALVTAYPDGSALYECLVQDHDRLPAQLAIPHRDFRLRLHHHTSPENLARIVESRHLRGSRWNYHGSKELHDRHFIYLTDVPRIDRGINLMEIAMSDGGFTLGLRYDQPGLSPEMLSVPVRGRGQMSAALELWVEPWLVEPSPMLFHDSGVAEEGVGRYWELFHPRIFRIPVRPGTVCEVRDDRIVDARAVPGWIRSDRILAGCAFQLGALRTVFDEYALDELPINVGVAPDEPCPFNRFLAG